MSTAKPSLARIGEHRKGHARLTAIRGARPRRSAGTLLGAKVTRHRLNAVPFDSQRNGDMLKVNAKARAVRLNALIGTLSTPPSAAVMAATRLRKRSANSRRGHPRSSPSPLATAKPACFRTYRGPQGTGRKLSVGLRGLLGSATGESGDVGGVEIQSQSKQTHRVAVPTGLQRGVGGHFDHE